MEQNTQTESGFRITQLILLESNFKREATINFDPSKTTSVVNVDVNVQVAENTIFVTETLTYKQMFEEVVEVSAEIKMVGVFEKTGDVSFDLNNFGQINGAAIIFPYIREQLTNLSAKAGIGLIVIPPFNFTKKTD